MAAFMSLGETQRERHRRNTERETERAGGRVLAHKIEMLIRIQGQIL